MSEGVIGLIEESECRQSVGNILRSVWSTTETLESNALQGSYDVSRFAVGVFIVIPVIET
jgi:hypothetical protein